MRETPHCVSYATSPACPPLLSSAERRPLRFLQPESQEGDHLEAGNQIPNMTLGVETNRVAKQVSLCLNEDARRRELEVMLPV